MLRALGFVCFLLLILAVPFTVLSGLLAPSRLCVRPKVFKARGFLHFGKWLIFDHLSQVVGWVCVEWCWALVRCTCKRIFRSNIRISRDWRGLWVVSLFSLHKTWCPVTTHRLFGDRASS